MSDGFSRPPKNDWTDDTVVYTALNHQNTPTLKRQLEMMEKMLLEGEIPQASYDQYARVVQRIIHEREEK